jgi:hypothetical protein
MFDEDNEDGDDNEDFDVAQLFLGSAPAMQWSTLMSLDMSLNRM